MGGYHYWKGGDDDPRDQVGVDPTGPAATNDKGGEAHDLPHELGQQRSGSAAYVTGGPAADPQAAAGPPDLQQAIQAATGAFDRELRQRSLDAPDIIRIAVEAAAPVLLHATRDRLADLEGEYELTKARFNDFADEALERDRQRVVQLEDMDRVVSLANAERNEARDRLADLEDENAILRRVAKHAEWIGLTGSTSHCPVCAGWKEQGHTPGCRLAAALDGPAAQEEGGQACDACGGLFTHDPQCSYLTEEPAAQEECGWVHWPTEEDADAEGWCHLPSGHQSEHQPKDDGPAAQEEDE